MSSRGILVVACVALLGCRTTTVERIAPPSPARIDQGAAARTWEVFEGGEPIGRVVAFRSEDRPEEPMFVVQNVWNQDLGMVDGLGRAWRFRPHREEAEWLGTGTVADGAAWILASPGCELRELPLQQAREAVSRR